MRIGRTVGSAVSARSKASDCLVSVHGSDSAQLKDLAFVSVSKPKKSKGKKKSTSASAGSPVEETAVATEVSEAKPQVEEPKRSLADMIKATPPPPQVRGGRGDTSCLVWLDADRSGVFCGRLPRSPMAWRRRWRRRLSQRRSNRRRPSPFRSRSSRRRRCVGALARGRSDRLTVVDAHPGRVSSEAATPASA
jgi:hypothetical protein